MLDELPSALASACPAARYAVVADSTVAKRFGPHVTDLAGAVAPTDLVSFPAGEWNKTRESWTAITDRLLELGLGRDAAIIALGGGVTGDLAGFVAATYLRGIPFAQVPTTLLAMIDSSIGGKTGVDTSAGKNLVGAFHQPRVVIADVDTLVSLPAPHLAAGAAEALKHGAITDAAYFDRLVHDADRILAHDPEALGRAVRRSVEIKAAVVAEDERERGVRATLNFGHTVGHALEAVSGYELLHGEAVAIGMLVEAEIGRGAGITAGMAVRRVRAAIEALQLPSTVPTNRVQDVLDAMLVDKKARAGTVRFAFIEEVGKAARDAAGNWTFEAPKDLVERALRV